MSAPTPVRAVLAALVLLGGCASTPEPETTIGYERTRHGTLVPCIDGACYEPSAADERQMIVDLLNAYGCPAEIEPGA